MSKLDRVADHPQLQKLLDQAKHCACTRQRHTFAIWDYRTQLAGTTPMTGQVTYFFDLFRWITIPGTLERPEPVRLSLFVNPDLTLTRPSYGTIPTGALASETAALTKLSTRCSSYSKFFASLTALDGHSEAQCTKGSSIKSFLATYDLVCFAPLVRFPADPRMRTVQNMGERSNSQSDLKEHKATSDQALREIAQTAVYVAAEVAMHTSCFNLTNGGDPTDEKRPRGDRFRKQSRPDRLYQRRPPAAERKTDHYVVADMGCRSPDRYRVVKP